MKKASKEKIVQTLKRSVLIFNRWRKIFKVEYIDLSNCSFSGAYLYRVNFYNVNLSKCNFYKANLGRANLYKTNMHKAYLNKANLTYARFWKTNLSKANLSQSNMSNAIGVYFFNMNGGPLCFAVVNGDKLSINTPDFWGDIDSFEAAEYAKSGYPDNLSNVENAQIKYLRLIEKTLKQ